MRKSYRANNWRS